MFKLGDKVIATSPHASITTDVAGADRKMVYINANSKGVVVTVMRHLDEPPTFLVNWGNDRLSTYYQSTGSIELLYEPALPPLWGTAGP